MALSGTEVARLATLKTDPSLVAVGDLGLVTTVSLRPETFNRVLWAQANSVAARVAAVLPLVSSVKSDTPVFKAESSCRRW